METLTGTKVSSTANKSEASPRATVSTLRTNGTNVFLQISSHDYMVPWVDQFRYLNKLQSTGVRFDATINYMAGRYTDPDLLSSHLSRALTRYQAGLSPVLTSGKITRRAVLNGRFTTLTTSSDPFTIELPRLLTPSLKGNIHVTGVPGTVWRIEFTPAGYLAPVMSEYTIGTDGTSVIPIDALPIGKLVLNNITFKEPGAADFVQVNRATTTADHAVDVRDVDPSVASSGRGGS
jgi:hypothetical protein